MASNFAVNVTAKDSASGTLDAINKNLASVNKTITQARAPFDKLVENATKFSRVTGISKIATSLRSVAHSGFSAFQSVARIVEPLAAISGAASIAGMMKLAMSWANFGTELGNAANRAGLTSTQLMTLENAGRLAGVSAEAMASGMTTLRDNMVNAVGGKAPQVIAMMQALGLSIDDAKRFAADTTKALPELADKIAGLKDPTLQAEAATALFGGAGEAMLPFLRKGSVGIEEYNAKVRKYGLISADGVTAANDLREAQANLTMSVEGLGYSVAQKLAPVITPLLQSMADWIAANRDWIAQGIGQKVSEFADYMKGVNWTKVGEGIMGIVHAVIRVVDAIGGIKPAAEIVVGFMGITWLAQMLLPIVAISKALLKLPGEAAVAAAKSEAELSKPGLLGKVGTALAGGVAAHEALTAVDPDDKMGSWIDRNVPGASFIDNLASHVGLGRSYEEQGKTDHNLAPPGPQAPNASMAGKGAHPAEVGRRDPTVPSGRNTSTAPGLSGAQWGNDLKQLQSYGWSREQAAGILGNLSQESEGREDAVGDNKAAYGLGQWHADRQANFAKQFGHDIKGSTHAEQIAFVNWELNNTEKSAGDHLRQTNDARSSAAAVRRYYERPLDANGQEDTMRGNRAERILATAGPSLSLPADAGTASNPGVNAAPIAPAGKVDIGVRFANAPAGTQTTAVQTGTGLSPLRVERSDVGYDSVRLS